MRFERILLSLLFNLEINKVNKCAKSFEQSNNEI